MHAASFSIRPFHFVISNIYLDGWMNGRTDRRRRNYAIRIRQQQQERNCQTDGRTDGRTDDELI